MESRLMEGRNGGRGVQESNFIVQLDLEAAHPG